MTSEEFLRWAEGEEGRWELHDGVPVMMSPERVLHGDVKGEAYVALREAVRRAGLPCRAYPDGVAVRISAKATYQPDASVYCGPRPPIDAQAIDCPVVVEVLSPSTAAIDHGRKLIGYFSLPSVEHTHPRSGAPRRHPSQASKRCDRDAGVVGGRR
jgi:Uma2 family endonuclease